MAEYREVYISGIRFQRPISFNLVNGYGETKRWSIAEQEVTIVSGEVKAIKPVDGVAADYDGDTVVTLYDPTTGVATGGTTTMQTIFVALWSLWYQLALERDAG